MLRAGLALPPHQLALASASHSAEPFHLDAVRDMLAAAGLTEADLQNTPDLPYDPEERDIWVAAGRPPRSLAQNCSGKHAAMLATCRLNGWDLATYRDPDHPAPAAMAAAIADLAGEPVAATAVDGCGAPVMAISLAGLARAFGRLSAGPGTPRGDRRRRDPRPPRVPRRHAARRHRPDPRHRGRHRQGRRRVRLRRRPRRRHGHRPQGRRRRPARPTGDPRGCCAASASSRRPTTGSRTPRCSATASRSARSWPSGSRDERR